MSDGVGDGGGAHPSPHRCSLLGDGIAKHRCTAAAVLRQILAKIYQIPAKIQLILAGIFVRCGPMVRPLRRSGGQTVALCRLRRLPPAPLLRRMGIAQKCLSV